MTEQKPAGKTIFDLPANQKNPIIVIVMVLVGVMFLPSWVTAIIIGVALPVGVLWLYKKYWPKKHVCKQKHNCPDCGEVLR